MYKINQTLVKQIVKQQKYRSIDIISSRVRCWKPLTPILVPNFTPAAMPFQQQQLVRVVQRIAPKFHVTSAKLVSVDPEEEVSSILLSDRSYTALFRAFDGIIIYYRRVVVYRLDFSSR